MAAAAASASQPKVPPTPADFDVGDLGAASNFAFLQHLQMQAQLQAQQFGYAPQQHAQLQSMLAGPGMASLPPALSAYPGAYQQILNSLLAQQGGAGLGLPAPGMQRSPSAASVHPYDVAAAANQTPGPFPQGLGSAPMDLGQLLAAQAQAAQAQAVHQQAASMHRNARPSVPDPSQLRRGLPYGAGLTPAPSVQSTASGGDLAPGISPTGWGWGSSAGNPLLPEMPSSKSHPSLQVHPDLMLAQAQANVRAAQSAQSEYNGSLQVPYGGEER